MRAPYLGDVEDVSGVDSMPVELDGTWQGASSRVQRRSNPSAASAQTIAARVTRALRIKSLGCQWRMAVVYSVGISRRVVARVCSSSSCRKARRFRSSMISSRARTNSEASRRLSASTAAADRKSTRLNSSHLVISYAVFCLKKKKKYNLRTSIAEKYECTTFV